ncbi:transposase DNA-binding-containing protein [Halomonas sp. HAL1]|uniref:IS4/Tn5 family transposase DNA-binding protein n=4 Tax=Halomonas sp. HAL1 TaxID=550984 RepID=UPI0026E100C4|nr:transposase DNA-binding-containing protein [Halomonas sp. HAL1]WKV92337.1 transposase DNA-binding-containing protein [Halomonas sp. HAL1]
MALLLTWFLVAWLGWFLLFCSSPQAVVLSSSNATASLVERAYYTGYTLTTLGYGDFVAGNDNWRLPAVLAAANGFFLFTLSITYILNIITNVIQKRQTSLTISALGENPQQILASTSGDGKFATLVSQLQPLQQSISTLGQQHLAYPILHYYHSETSSKALSLAIALQLPTSHQLHKHTVDKVKPDVFFWLLSSFDMIRGINMGQHWVNEEMTGCDLGDARLNQRLAVMLEALGDRPDKSLPTAFQDWANTKAAYRFFANENVSEDKILEGHFAASALRIQATDGPILILQDTTEFSFKRSSPEKIGFINESTGRKMKEGRHLKHTVCGLLMHASLAITTEGLPLGLTAAKFWTRNKFKGTEALKRKVNPTRVPIEQKESMRWLDNLQRSTELAGSPERCVHIGDRESDIFELFCLAQDLGTYFLIRSCVDRLAEEGGTTISQVMAETQVSGTHDIHFRDKRGNQQQATLSVKHAKMTVCPPIGKQKKYPKQKLGIIFAEEKNPPEGRSL